MLVFNTFFKIMKKNIRVIMVYVGIFAAIGFIMTNNTQASNSYSDYKVSVAVLDEDNSEASKLLTEYIGKKHKISDIDKDKVTDALYYYNIEYILTINKGYGEKIAQGITTDLFTNTKHPSTYVASIFDSELEQYVKTIGMYTSSGFDIETACAKTDEILSKSVDVNNENFNDVKDDTNKTSGTFFQYLPYLFISILISTLSEVLITLNGDDIRYRTNSSSFPEAKKTYQTILASTIYVLIIWLIFMVLYELFGLILYSNCTFDFTKHELLAMLNSFITIIISSGIAMIVSQFNVKKEALSMLSNIIGLGSSFLCGVFVPQEMLGDTVHKFSSFFPFYWYVKANNLIFSIGGETYNSSELAKSLALEAAFILPIFAFVFLISKIRHSSSKTL